jgi:outer membrane protein assembly factor BamB
LPPEDEDGVIAPETDEELGEHAVERLFGEYFRPSGYASLRDNRTEEVSQIFEDREDNLAKIDELEEKLRDLYPSADVLRTRSDAELYDREGPEWEYNEDIVLLIANVRTKSPPIRWQFGYDIYGKQLTPPGAVTNGCIALTDGQELYGLNSETGNVIWSTQLPERTNRSPTLIGETVIVETKGSHRAYHIRSGDNLWNLEEAPTTTTTRHVPLNNSCYFGDFEGTVWELSSDGECRAVGELNERIISVYPTEKHVYALKRGDGKSGTTPESVHKIAQDSGDEIWTYSPEESLTSEMIVNSDHALVSTNNKIVALQAESGDVAWVEPNIDPDPGDERDLGTTTDDGQQSGDWRAFDSSSQRDSPKEEESRTGFAEQPIIDDDIFAPTNKGLLRISPNSGEIIWESLTNHVGDTQWLAVQIFSPPTQDEDTVYIGADDTVYAVDKQDGEIVWQFETPSQPGTMTFCPDSESLTFVTRGLAINVDANEKC